MKDGAPPTQPTGEVGDHPPAAEGSAPEVGSAAPVIDLAAWRQRRPLTSGGAA